MVGTAPSTGYPLNFIRPFHHRRVARPSVSIAISTSWRHFERSCARIHAVLRPRLWGRRSSSIVRSHVRLGRPARRRQSAGGRLMAARRMREWSCDGSALARCPNRRSRLFAITEVTGGWPVLRLTSSLVICAVYGICTIRRRHHWSNASRRRLEATVILHVSAP